MPARSASRGERAYASIRSDILAGRLRPGGRLPFAGLCSRYGASMGVLREALSRLAEQRLVVLEPQQGYRVVSLSADDLVDLTSARVQIETLVLREATANGDLAWESRLLAVHHTLARTPVTSADEPDRLSEAWTAAHAEFHSALLAGGSSRRLRAIAEGLRDSAELYRQWSVPADRGHARDIAAEHRALLDAALDRDAETAAAVLTAHIEYTTRLLLGRPAEEPDGSRSAI